MKKIAHFFLFWISLFEIIYEVFSSLKKRPFYYKETVNHIYDFGYRSLSTALILGISTGGVLTLHIGKSIEKYGAKLYVPKILSLAVFGEFAPVLTAIILAGRIGAGITSEIGTMKVTEQIDAIQSFRGLSRQKSDYSSSISLPYYHPYSVPFYGSDCYPYRSLCRRYYASLRSYAFYHAKPLYSPIGLLSI